MHKIVLSVLIFLIWIIVFFIFRLNVSVRESELIVHNLECKIQALISPSTSGATIFFGLILVSLLIYYILDNINGFPPH